MELDDRKKLNELIGTATRANAAHLNQEHIQEIKNIIKKSKENVDLALELMVKQLKEKNSQVRYLALGLINWLIERSSNARLTLAEQLPNLIPLFIAQNVVNSNKIVTQLPEPTEFATKLSALGVTLLREWTDKYAAVNAFKRAQSYLETLKAKSPVLRETRVTSQQPLVSPLLMNEIDEHVTDIASQLLQVENAVEVLADRSDQLDQFIHELQHVSEPTAEPDEFADIEFEEVECGQSALTLDEVIRTHGLGSDTYELELSVPLAEDQPASEEVAEDTEPISALLSSTVLPLLKEAQSKLTHLLHQLKAVPEGNYKSRAVNRAVTLQQRLTRVRARLIECGLVQEKKIDQSVPASEPVASNTNVSVAPPPPNSRKRKSAGDNSKRPKQRRKTR